MVELDYQYAVALGDLCCLFLVGLAAGFCLTVAARRK